MPNTEELMMESWQKRWRNNPVLVKQIVEILKGSGPTNDTDESTRRLLEANKFLQKANDSILDPDIPRFIIADGRGSYSPSTYPLDLRGILCDKLDLTGAVFQNAHLENARFSWAILDDTNFKHAYLHHANLCNVQSARCANFSSSQLLSTDMSDATIQGAIFEAAHMEGAYLVGADLRETDFQQAKVGVWARTSRELWDTGFDSLTPNDSRTQFGANPFISHYTEWMRPWWYPMRWDWAHIRRSFLCRWLTPNFRGVRIEDSDTMRAPDLNEFAQIQRLIERTKSTYPVIYQIWNFASGCGQSFSRLMSWAILSIILFAFCYQLCDPLFCFPGMLGNMHKDAAIEYLYVSIGTFLSVNDLTATSYSILGNCIILLETILGWITLGLAITVFANKYARRS